MRKYWMTALMVALGALLGGALLAAPASATPTQEGPITVVQSDCADGGEVTIKIIGVEYNVSSEVKTAGLAARVDGEVFANTQVGQDDGTYSADEELVIGPFDVDTVVEFRWFAGPDRNDLPMWTASGPSDGAAWDDAVEFIVDLEDAEGRHWDARDVGPFVTWYTFDAEGCPASSPTPTATPSASPTPGATAEPSTAPSTEAEPELPVTGSNLPVVLGGVAVLLGLTGGGLMVLGRRRRISIDELEAHEE